MKCTIVISLFALTCTFESVNSLDSVDLISPLQRMAMKHSRSQPETEPSPVYQPKTTTYIPPMSKEDDLQEEETTESEPQVVEESIVGKFDNEQEEIGSTSAPDPITELPKESTEQSTIVYFGDVDMNKRIEEIKESFQKSSEENPRPVYVPTTEAPTEEKDEQILEDKVKEVMDDLDKAHKDLDEAHKENIDDNIVETDDASSKVGVSAFSFSPLLTSIGASILLGGLAYYIFPDNVATSRSDSTDDFFDHGARIVHLSELTPRELERLRGAHAYRVSARSGTQAGRSDLEMHPYRALAIRVYNFLVPSFMEIATDENSRSIQVVKKMSGEPKLKHPYHSIAKSKN